MIRTLLPRNVNFPLVSAAPQPRILPLCKALLLVFLCCAVRREAACQGALETSRKEKVLPKGVVLVVIDSLPAHSLSKTSDWATPPYLATMSKESLHFENAYSTSSWTRPAIASMLTGLLPHQHGVIGVESVFKEGVQPIAQILAGHGMSQRLGVVSHSLISEQTTFATGFSNYMMIPLKGDVHTTITSKEVTDTALLRLKEVDSNRPFFLFVHYFDPHYSYQHHPRFDRSSWYRGDLRSGSGFMDLWRNRSTFSQDDFKFLLDLHREEVLNTDEELGRLLREIKVKHTHDILTILTSDHGEEFGEHGGIGHGRSMYQEVIKVPLLVKYPDNHRCLSNSSDQHIPDPVSTADIFPTILDFFGISETPSAHTSSSSLLPTLCSQNKLESKRGRIIFSEVDLNASMISAVKDDYKLIFDKRLNRYLLFSLKNDPQEKSPLTTDDFEIGRILRRDIDVFKSGQETTSTTPETIIESHEAPKDIAKRLRSLGYLN